MIVTISRDNYNKILQQGKNEFPIECCGLLGGIKSDEAIMIKEVYPLYNTDQSSEHFSMDPKEQFKVIKEMRKNNLELVGNYHSHPYTPSRPSEEDKKLAYDPKVIYGILSLADENPVFNFFQIVEQSEVEKLDLKIIE
ncbi:proteasome lid subunit RPN8/RPN11 [Natranaerovirga hydrolytica]|uniref:Proteasome lid subunit RPN8/RPN11 n=1 Tax=Natranaerovirga hydrolytica TaxID=680378 RepID=A0A4R1MMH6_9FIRM|nr:proteasome lid subunit RPN8/RPN11 [Natranaerovirga hydrolytica]